MTELTQAELAKELGFWPATTKGWAWTWQRCGRYEYRKRLTHSTNPDHLISRGPSPTDVPRLRIAAEYAVGGPRVHAAVDPTGVFHPSRVRTHEGDSP
jgi:hypothetical protein